MSLAWADASSEERRAMVSVRVATVALSEAVVVARFARAFIVSACAVAFGEGKPLTAFAQGKRVPTVSFKLALYSRWAVAKNV